MIIWTRGLCATLHAQVRMSKSKIKQQRPVLQDTIKTIHNALMPMIGRRKIKWESMKTEGEKNVKVKKILLAFQYWDCAQENVFMWHKTQTTSKTHRIKSK